MNSRPIADHIGEQTDDAALGEHEQRRLAQRPGAQPAVVALGARAGEASVDGWRS